MGIPGLIGDDGGVSTAPRKSHYANGTVPNMVRSLLVVGALMALLWFMTPRVNTISGPKVDVAATAVDVKEQTGWPIVAAADLPQGWRETSARYVRSTGGLMTWHAGYQTPTGTYVAVEQTKDATNEWVEAQTNRARRVGELEAAGRTWVKYERGAKVQNSLLDRPKESGQLTTLITGTATFDEMAAFAAYLKPVSAN